MSSKIKLKGDFAQVASHLKQRSGGLQKSQYEWHAAVWIGSLMDSCAAGTHGRGNLSQRTAGGRALSRLNRNPRHPHTEESAQPIVEPIRTATTGLHHRIQPAPDEALHRCRPSPHTAPMHTPIERFMHISLAK